MKIKKVISFICIAAVAVGIVGMCGCDNTEISEKEDTASRISSIESNAASSEKTVSIPTNISDSGDFTDYIEVSADECYIEKDNITKAELAPLKNVQGTFVSESGVLCDGYYFVGVKLSLKSDRDMDLNLGSFHLVGIGGDDLQTNECFYQDGEPISDSEHDALITHIEADKSTAVTVGYFVTRDFFDCTSFYLEPAFFETDSEQNNYIQLSLDTENVK